MSSKDNNLLDFIQKSFLGIINLKEYTDITYNGQYLYATSRKKRNERLNINLSNEEVGDFLSHIANILGKNFNILNPFLDISFLTYRLSEVHPIIAKERKGGVYTFSLRIYQKELVIDTSSTSYYTKDVFELLKKLIENNIIILISGKTGFRNVNVNINFTKNALVTFTNFG